MTAIATGKLRHKVQLQARGDVQNPSTGEMVPTWPTVANIWAEIVPLSAREFREAAAEQSEVRGRIVIRYRPNIDATMRIVHRGMYYNILGVMPDAESGREHMTLVTAEGVRLEQ